MPPEDRWRQGEGTPATKKTCMFSSSDVRKTHGGMETKGKGKNTKKKGKKLGLSTEPASALQARISAYQVAWTPLHKPMRVELGYTGCFGGRFTPNQSTIRIVCPNDNLDYVGSCDGRAATAWWRRGDVCGWFPLPRGA